jgi:hypothetical protein
MGNTSTSSSTPFNTWQKGDIWYTYWVPSATGTVEDLRFYTGNAAGVTLIMEAGIYDQVSGQPTNLLGRSGPLTYVAPGTNGTVIFPIPGNLVLSNGTGYYLAVAYYNNPGTYGNFYLGIGGSTSYFSQGGGATALPDPLGATTGGPFSENIEMYVRLCE